MKVIIVVKAADKCFLSKAVERIRDYLKKICFSEADIIKCFYDYADGEKTAMALLEELKTGKKIPVARKTYFTDEESLNVLRGAFGFFADGNMKATADYLFEKLLIQAHEVLLSIQGEFDDEQQIVVVCSEEPQHLVFAALDLTVENINRTEVLRYIQRGDVMVIEVKDRQFHALHLRDEF